MFTHTAIRRAISRTHEATVRTIHAVDAGNNHSYRLGLRGGERLFLKVGTRFSEAFPAEPATVETIRRETDIPVPRVHTTGTEPLGYPFAVYEYVEGADVEWVRDLAPPVAKQLCREAGRHLASVHGFAFESFGRIGVDDDTLVVTDPWSHHDMLERSLDRQVEELRNTRFDAYCDPLSDLGTEWLDAIDHGRMQPALVHGDYRVANLCIDPEGDPVTAAVLDWELPTAGDPLWDVVMALTLLTEGYGIEPEERETYRAAFREGYGELPTDRDRWRYYELLGRLRLARHLSTEVEGNSEAAVDRADEHREAFEELLDGETRLQAASGTW